MNAPFPPLTEGLPQRWLRGFAEVETTVLLTGEVEWVLNFKEDVLDGTAKQYARDGRLIRTCVYQQGVERSCQQEADNKPKAQVPQR